VLKVPFNIFFHQLVSNIPTSDLEILFNTIERGFPSIIHKYALHANSTNLFKRKSLEERSKDVQQSNFIKTQKGGMYINDVKDKENEFSQNHETVKTIVEQISIKRLQALKPWKILKL